MTVTRPAPGELEPIETASRDEIQALQLQRLRWSLQHAYDNVPHYRKAFDEKCVRPCDLKTLLTCQADIRTNLPHLQRCIS